MCGKVDLVTPQFVDVGLRRIDFDYLVIATGSSAQSGLKAKSITVAGRRAALLTEHQRIDAPDAKNVLVVGGGVTSIELAAALKTNNPDRKVRAASGHHRSLSLHSSLSHALSFIPSLAPPLFECDNDLGTWCCCQVTIATSASTLLPRSKADSELNAAVGVMAVSAWLL